MAFRCNRFEHFFTSSALSLNFFCRRYASSPAVLAQVRPNEHEHQTNDASQPLNAPVKSPRRPRVQEYLNYVAENSELTLADLESFRPESHSPVGSAQYEAEYQALMERLDRSFTVSQLRQFLHLYGVHVSARIRKQNAAATIIEKQWGWPSLSKSQKLAKAKKERSSRVFSLNPQQAFLLLGKDGLEILSLSQMYNVRLQFSRKPLSLTVSGTTDSVEQLERYVESLKKEIVWRDFDPPRKIDLSSSSQQLSRASGCFLEGLPDGKIRVWYRESSKDSPARAERLLMQHAIEDIKVPLAASPAKSECVLSPLEHIPTYAFYPFFCESASRLVGNKGRFRLRRVGKWFGEDNSVVSHTADGVTHVYVATIGNYDNAREQLLAQVVKSAENRHFSVAATPGHVVINSQGSQFFSLTPPLEGQKSFNEVIDWIREHNPDTEFIRGAPMRFWQVPESGQGWRRRLVYETFPGSSEQTRAVICEYTPEKPMGNVPVETGVDSSEPEKVPKPVLHIGPVTKLDVLMPDNARDLRLVLTCGDTMPETSWPTELLKYIKSDTSSLVPDEIPLVFEHDNRKYILKEDFYVQSDVHPVNSGNFAVHAVSERRFDPQGEESYLTYEIRCADVTSDDSWNTFWNKCGEIVRDSSSSALDGIRSDP